MVLFQLTFTCLFLLGNLENSNAMEITGRTQIVTVGTKNTMRDLEKLSPVDKEGIQNELKKTEDIMGKMNDLALKAQIKPICSFPSNVFDESFDQVKAITTKMMDDTTKLCEGCKIFWQKCLNLHYVSRALYQQGITMENNCEAMMKQTHSVIDLTIKQIQEVCNDIQAYENSYNEQLAKTSEELKIMMENVKMNTMNTCKNFKAHVMKWLDGCQQLLKAKGKETLKMSSFNDFLGYDCKQINNAQFIAILEELIQTVFKYWVENNMGSLPSMDPFTPNN